jgi:hypothetical protein
MPVFSICYPLSVLGRLFSIAQKLRVTVTKHMHLLSIRLYMTVMIKPRVLAHTKRHHHNIIERKQVWLTSTSVFFSVLAFRHIGYRDNVIQKIRGSLVYHG